MSTSTKKSTTSEDGGSNTTTIGPTFFVAIALGALGCYQCFVGPSAARVQKAVLEPDGVTAGESVDNFAFVCASIGICGLLDLCIARLFGPGRYFALHVMINATIVCFSYCEFLTLSRQQLSSLLKSAGGDSHSQLFRTAIMDGVQMRAANTARQQPPSGRRGTSFGVRERSKSVVRRPSKEEEDTAPTPTSTQGKSKTSRRLSLTDRLKRSPRVNVKVPSNSAMTQEANRADQVPA